MSFTSYCCTPRIPENQSEIQVLFQQRSVASRDFKSEFSLIAAFWSFTEQLVSLDCQEMRLRFLGLQLEEDLKVPALPLGRAWLKSQSKIQTAFTLPAPFWA